MSNYIFEGLTMYAIAWVLKLYPDAITIIYTLKLVSNKENKPYIDYIAKCLFWVLIIMGTVLVIKGLCETLRFM